MSAGCKKCPQLCCQDARFLFSGFGGQKFPFEKNNFCPPFSEFYYENFKLSMSHVGLPVEAFSPNVPFLTIFRPKNTFFEVFGVKKFFSKKNFCASF